MTYRINAEKAVEQPDPATAPTGLTTRPGRPKLWATVLFIRHEWTLAAIASVALSVLMTWPTMRAPLRTLPGDHWDPSLQAWQLAWTGWAIRHDPARLWDGNAHYGETWGLAYSDSLLGYLPAALIGTGPVAAVLRYNILYVLAFALAFFGMYVLARQLGARGIGAVVAGAAFAYSPWRLAHISHLNILSAGGIVLSLAMLARGHGYSLRHGYRSTEVRPRWALAGWLVAAWQITLGFGIGLPFGYVLATLCTAGLGWWLWKRPPFDRRLFRFDVAGVVVFLAVVAAVAYPYFRLIQDYPDGVRTLDAVKQYSVDHRQFFTAPERQWLWGRDNVEARMAIFDRGGWEAHHLVGFFLLGLAAAGLLVSAWPLRYRVLMLLGTLGFAWLGMGLEAPSSYPYEVLFHRLPGWNAIRTPGRLVLWMTVLLSLLAAGLMTALAERARRLPDGRISAWRLATAVALLIPGGLVLLEGAHDARFPEVPRPPVAFASLAGPVLVLPTTLADDELTQLWSTDGFVPVANGSSGYIPPGLHELRKAVQTFPDAPSVAFLRARGIRTVLALRHPSAAPWPEQQRDPTSLPDVFTRSVDGLGITRAEHPDAIVFDVSPR